MDDLINQISNLVIGFGGGDSALLVSVRQKSIAEESIRFLNDSLSAASEALEVKAECIRLASESVGRLTGRVDVEEWLGAIFSRFCIGK
jgi:tRNA modification GTPase